MAIHITIDTPKVSTGPTSREDKDQTTAISYDLNSVRKDVDDSTSTQKQKKG